jgi:hypothetical protein
LATPSTANKATIVFFAGVAMVGGGAALYFLAPKGPASNERSALYVTPAISPDGVGVVLGGKALVDYVGFAKRLWATRQRQFATGLVVFLIGATALVWNMKRASPVVEWMNIFRLDDFKSFGDAFPFISELRVPIPPHLALLEIANYRLTGDTAIASGLLYKGYIVVSYACVLLLAYPSRLRLVASGLLGCLFIFATKLIHPGNPMIYDVAAPCFFMLFALLLRIGTETQRPRAALAALVAAGFFLSMFELSRPFIILLLPFILVFAYARIGSARRFAALLIPLVLISGTWHVHLAAAHRQMTASNHFGVNLWRCWNSRVPPLEKPVPEDDAPLAEGRWANLNNPQHLKNSLRLRKKIGRYIRTHPGDSAAFMLERVFVLTKGEAAIYAHKPSHVLFAVYSPAVRLTSFIIIGGCLWFFGRLAWLVIRRREHLRGHVGDLDNLIAFVGFATILVLAIGEVEEEARFVISVLPLLAVVPLLHRIVELGRTWRNPPRTARGTADAT